MEERRNNRRKKGRKKIEEEMEKKIKGWRRSRYTVGEMREAEAG